MMSLPEGQEAESTGTKDMSSLPPEVLERIFGFLTEENLYLCGQVCNDWAKLIERMPPKMTWSHWFAKQVIGDVMLTFRHTNGSRFSKVEDINEIRTEVDKLLPKEQTSNPFINNTVIVSKDTLREYHSLHENLVKFMTQFGPHVHRLIYYLDMNTPQSLNNLDLILKTLSNLRSLTLYNPGGCLDSCNLSFVPETLSELEFLGSLDSRFLERFTRVHGPQIQSLTINLEGLATVMNRELRMLMNWNGIGRAVQNCSNLKRLKISALDLTYQTADDPQYFKELRIEHLAINNLKCIIPCQWISVSQIMKAICIFGDSIETLSFFGEIGNSKLCVMPKESVPPRTSIRVLNILLSAAGTDDFPILLGGFPNLKKLTLFDREDTYRNRWLKKEELEKICEPLWAHVSPSVESISIRSRVYSKISKKCFPTVFICDRSQN